MIFHTVLLKPKRGTTREEMLVALAQTQALQQQIPGIIAVQVGKNLNTSNNKEYTYGFIMQFVDEKHLRAYAPHPAHQVVSAELVRLCQDIIDFDLAV